MNNEIVPGFDDEKDHSLKIRLQRIEEVPFCLMLSLSGQIDTCNFQTFEWRVGKAIAAGFIRLIFDMAGLLYDGEVGIGCYGSFLKAVRELGGDLCFTGWRPEVSDVYALLGFMRPFKTCANVDEAISFLASPEKKEKIFPIIFKCPTCGRRLRTDGIGRIRCSECKTILIIDGDGQPSIEGANN